MNDSTATWLMVFVAVTSVAVVIQMGVLVGLFISVRKTSARMETLVSELHAKALPILDDARAILSDAKPKIATVTDDLVVTSAQLREQTAKVGAVVTDAVDRARLQIIRADEMVTGTLGQVEATASLVSQNVVKPVKQVGAVLQGLTVALGTYLGRTKQGRVIDGSEQEEEMFI